MLELLRSDIALFLALAGILIAMFFPIAAVWITFSIRRDIHRIADALGGAAQVAKVYESALDRGLCIVSQEDAGRVANSAFGR